MNVRIVHLPTDPTADIEVLSVPSDDLADRLHTLCAGYFETVRLQGDVHVWLNEDGKGLGLPFNARAQTVWEHSYGRTDMLVGPAVLTGGADAAGDTLGLSDEQLEQLERTLTVVRVRVENTYEDGHESVLEYLVREPVDASESALEEWVEEKVYPLFGDGHGAEHPKLGSHHEATVTSRHSVLHGRSWEQS